MQKEKRKRKGRNPLEKCKRGHDMSVFRKMQPNGDPYCSMCKKLHSKQYTKENVEKVKLYRKRFFLKKNYGITLEDYKELLELQNHKCAICNSIATTRSLHVDHDHNTKQVRGLLCHGCNTALGLFKEDSDILMLAIEYLSKAGKSRKKRKKKSK